MAKSEKVKVEAVYKTAYSLQISVEDDNVVIEDDYNDSEIYIPLTSIKDLIKALQEIADATQ